MLLKILLEINFLRAYIVVFIFICNIGTSIANNNFLSLKTREEIILTSIINTTDQKSDFFLNGNLSKGFQSIFDDVTSDNENRITNRVNEIIGLPLRSSATLGFSLPFKLKFGYFFSYEVFAIAQNPTFPNIDASIQSSHNLWIKKNYNIFKNLTLELFPIIGLRRQASESKELGAIINDSIELDINDESYKAFAALNFDLKYTHHYFDLNFENYNYSTDQKDQYSSFLSLTSYLDYSKFKLYTKARYRVAQAFSIIEAKKIDLITGIKFRKNIDFSLSLNELHFLNTSLSIKYAGLDLSLAHIRHSLDILQQQVSENYNFTLRFRF